MTQETALAEMISACGLLVAKTEDCERRLTAFFAYYLDGEGTCPRREDWPSRVLNPKLNGTNPLLKRLRDALSEFLPHTLPREGVVSLNEFVRAGTSFVETLEHFRRTESLSVSYTTEYDVFGYMTTSFENLGAEQHARNLRAKFKAMKESFYANAAVAYAIETEILRESPYYEAPRSAMTAYGETYRRLCVHATRQDAAVSSTERTRPKGDITIAMAERLLAERCARENLLDFAPCARTIRRWEKGAPAPAGYTVNCRTSLQAFCSWMEAFIIEKRAMVAGRTALVSFCDNLHSRATVR